MTDINNSYIVYPSYPTHYYYQWPTRTTKTVVVEKFYDADGRLIKEITTTTETPHYTTYTGGTINAPGSNSNVVNMPSETSIKKPKK